MANKEIDIYLSYSSLRTCLGDKTETMRAMSDNKTGLKYDSLLGMYAGKSHIETVIGYSKFESLLIEQIANVLSQADKSLLGEDTQLIISTTKGNIDFLAQDSVNLAPRAFIYTAAKAVADYFNFSCTPIVISNACISGVSAFVVAREKILSGESRHVIVAGADILCDFITSGFASFKSISTSPCRPYDIERDGLTLGDAAGAVLLTTETDLVKDKHIRLAGGAISNDANHISGPSRTGDGLYYAINNAMNEAGIKDRDVAFLNLHGTATRYNDEMESKAVAWAKLENKPTNSLKGYIGHTLGASGVVETIISAEQLKQGYIYGTKGFSVSDTPYKLKLSSEIQTIEGTSCIKTSSGFGGCNAAIVLDMGKRGEVPQPLPVSSKVVAEYKLPSSELPFAQFIREEFKSFGESNMKFYKMSDMSKALYVAVERLLKIEGFEDIAPTRRAIILANSSASLDADIMHQQILNKNLPEGASPAVFVYTLANVAAGEMCIRHKIQGDNTFFIENEDSGLAERYAITLINQGRADAVICGWCEYINENWNINIKLIKTN